MISTDRFDGFTVEGGPTRSSPTSRGGSSFASRLGLGDQLVETDSSHRRSFVVCKGRLVPVPEGFVLMAPHRLLPILTTPILSWRGKLRFLMDLVIPRHNDDEGEESLARFRAPAVRARGPGSAGSAAGRGHLYGRSQRPEPEGDIAPVPGHGARPWQPDSGGLAGVASPRHSPPRAASLGGAVRHVRHPGRRHGHAAPSPGRRACRRADSHGHVRSAGSAVTSRSLPGWSSSWTARRSKRTP